MQTQIIQSSVHLCAIVPLKLTKCISRLSFEIICSYSVHWLINYFKCKITIFLNYFNGADKTIFGEEIGV